MTLIFQLKESKLKLWIYNGHENSENSGPAPFCKFVNIQLSSGVNPGVGVKGNMGTILLENPKGDYCLTYQELLKQVFNTLPKFLQHLRRYYCIHFSRE